MMSDEIVSALVKRCLPKETATIGPQAFDAAMGFASRNESLPPELYGGHLSEILDELNAVFTAGSFFAACVQIYLTYPEDKAAAKQRVEALTRKEPTFYGENDRVCDMIEEELRNVSQK